VAKGFEQREGYDYEEIFSHVARMETVRLIIALAAQRQWEIHQLDVKSAFLNDPFDWGGDSDERKSTSGHCFMIGKTVCLWSSKKQSIVALSTCETEYVATTTSVCQSVWLNNIMTQIGFNLDVPIKIYVDNVFAINLAKNSVFHQISKHIDIRYHFLRDQVGKNMIKLEYCKSKYQIADILFKPLKIDAFIKLRDMLGMKVVPNQN